MAQIDDILKVTEQKFTGDEEFLAPNDAIIKVLTSLNSSGEDTPNPESNKTQKISNNMATPSKPNGDTGDAMPPLASKDPKISAFEKRLLEDPIDHEINVGDGFHVSTPTPSPSPSAPSTRGRGRGGHRGGRSTTTEIDTRWFVPFQSGWKREVVQRTSSEAYDTYYFPPEGKKLRSLVDIEKHLEKHAITNVTKANFTFLKRVIYKEPYDVMRTARPIVFRSELGAKGSPAPLNDSPGSSPSMGSGRGRGRGRGAKHESASDSDSSAKSIIRGRGRGRGTGGQKRERTSDTESLTAGSTLTSTPSGLYPNIAGTSSPWNSPSKPKKFKITSLLPATTLDVVDLTDSKPHLPSKPNKPEHAIGSVTVVTPVSLHHNKAISPMSAAQGVSGMQPISKGPVAKKRTGPVAKKRTAPRPSNGNAVVVVPPRKHPTNSFPGGSAGTTTLCGLACPGREGLPPTLHCKKCMMLFHPACVGQHANTTDFTCTTCGSSSSSQPKPVHVVRAPVHRPPVSSVGGATAVVPAKSSSDSVSTVDLSRIINQNQVSGQLLTLPPGVLNHLDMSQPLALKVNNKVLMIPPNCFISSDSAVKVFLPPGTLPNTLFKEKNLPINFNFYAKNNEQILNFTDPGSNPPPVTKDAASGDGAGDNDKENVADVPQVKLSHKQLKVAPSNECHFLKLHSGYDCMINIFKFLSIADLLRAARVCRTWTKVSCQDSLWKVVKLKGSRVSDWEQAARRFKNHNTWFLDLQGMLLSEDRNRTWHQFTAVLENLDQLRHMHFGHSPACILHAVVEKLDKLEVLCAESVTDMVAESQMWTTNTKIDIGKFAALKQLEHLKLRGVCGLVLPAFSFSGGLVDLAVLTNLKTLVLTTMRNIPDVEFLFLNNLKSLEVLEIGDCNMWTEEVYKQLGELNKLRSVRLEYSAAKPNPALSEALKQLKGLQKLELIRFAVDYTLEDALKDLPNLTSLTIWPHNEEEVALFNTNTLKAIKPLTALKTLDWGIIAEEGNANKKVESLPFLEDLVEGQKECEEKFISISVLKEQMGAALPTTKVTVFKVPLSKVSDRAVATPAAAAAPTITPTVATPSTDGKPAAPEATVVGSTSGDGETPADPVDLT